MVSRLPRAAPALRAEGVPRAPRPVPARAAAREFLLPLATGAAWMAIGAIALAVGRSEGLPPPERSGFGAGVAWLLGMSLVAAGGILVSWGLLRVTWWSRLQRHGRAADATVTCVAPVAWLRVAGRPPLDVELAFEDGHGAHRELRLRVRRSRRQPDFAVGDRLVIIHEPDRPDQAALYWRG